MLKTLCVIGIVQAFFLSFLIAIPKKKARFSQKLLVAWLLVISITLVFNWISFSQDSILFDLLLLIGGSKTLHGPLLYFYSISILDEKFEFQFKDLVHFLPYIIITIALFYFYYFGGYELSIRSGYLVFDEGAPFIISIYQWIILISTLGYPGLSLYLIHRHRIRRESYYSNQERIDQIWLRNFLIGVILGYFLIFLITDVVSIFIVITYSQVAVFSTLISVFLAYLATYVNYRHQSDLLLKPLHAPEEVTILDADENKLNKHYKTGLSYEKSIELFDRVELYMDRERPYLKSNLTLGDLAIALNTSTNHLSQVINEQSGKNFFRFINEYRVEAFKEIIEKGEQGNLTLVGIGLNCGFSSKSSFYTIFKKSTGFTPAEYVKSIMNSKFQ